MSLMPIYAYGAPELERWTNRISQADPSVQASASDTLAAVRSGGAAAVLESVHQFDCSSVESIFVSQAEFDQAEASEEEAAAIRTAIERVTDYHQTQLSVLTSDWQELPVGWGWRCDVTDSPDTGFEGQRMLPVRRVGIYVPGGRAAYPSSVIMNVVPAKVAGAEQIVVTTPCRPDGTVHPLVLFACKELGVETVIKAGGAAAIGALAFGIEGCPRVDVIAGPGNSYVNEAKRQVWGLVGLDGFAGPSEVAVIVDGTVEPHLSALDLLTQIEHAPDNVAVLVGMDPYSVDKVLKTCDDYLMVSPRRDDLSTAIREQSVAVVVDSLEEAADFVNSFAPEHASLHLADFEYMAEKLENCGCVMLGPDSAQSAGDYCSGPSHTLPTGGAARFASPVSVQTFLKTQSVSMLTKADMKELASTVDILANAEGFPIHGQGATARLSN